MASFINKPSNYALIKKLREAKKVTLKPCSYLKSTTKLRDYQSIGALHLLLSSRMILGDGVGLGKCINIESYIPTEQGLKKFKELLPKNIPIEKFITYKNPDKVLTMSGLKKPEAIYYCGEKKGLRIITKNGYTLEGLYHHPIYVINESGLTYKRLDELKKDSYVCIHRGGFFSNDILSFFYNKKEYFIKESFAEFLSFYTLSGYVKSNNLVIEESSLVLQQRIIILLCDILHDDIKSFSNDKSLLIIKNDKIIDFLKEISVKIKYNFTLNLIPAVIFKSPSSVISTFLRVLFEKRGKIDKHSKLLYLSLNSKFSGLVQEFLRQVQLLLLQFGIITILRSVRKVNRIKDDVIYYLYIKGRDLCLYKRNIGFISDSKNALLEKITQNIEKYDLEIIPYGNIFIKDIVKELLSYIKSGIIPNNIISKKILVLLKKVEYKKYPLTYGVLEQILSFIENRHIEFMFSKYTMLKDIQKKRFYFDQIRDIEPVGGLFADFSIPFDQHFISNGFISHNTIQLITSYAYRLVTEPNLKLLVITSNSAMEQWKEEIEKFCQGISAHVLSNFYGQIKRKGLENRYEYVEEFGDVDTLKKEGVKHKIIRGLTARKIQYNTIKTNVLITNYHTLKKDYLFLIQNRLPDYQVAFDECFSYYSQITLADGTVRFIGDIVQSGKSIEVLSYNTETKKVEPKKILNFFKNAAEQWVRVKKRKGEVTICSPTHEFYTSTGKKKANELSTNDILFNVGRILNREQMQILIGSLLYKKNIKYEERGDPYKISIELETNENEVYNQFKRDILKSHINSFILNKKDVYKNNRSLIQLRKSNILDLSILKIHLIDLDTGLLNIENILKVLTPVGLSVWFCDCGFLDKELRVGFKVYNYTKDDIDNLVSYFKGKWFFSLSKKIEEDYYMLFLNKEDSNIFLNLISDFIPECMKYKIGRICGGFWGKYDQKETWALCSNQVESISSFNCSEGVLQYRYNIEVEDNHNYFVDNTLVSNCQEFKNIKTSTWFAADKISSSAKYCYGLSATVIKNRLDEAYYIYQVIAPGIFPGKNKFFSEYTIRKKMILKKRGKGRRNLYFYKVTGYKNLKQFRDVIDPYFLSRKTRDVAKELPRLISRKLYLELTEAQKQLYARALSGDLYRKLIKERYFKYKNVIDSRGELTEKELKIYDQLLSRYEESLTEEGLRKNKIAALSYCQLISDGPGWLNEDGSSSKETEFLRLFDQELTYEKVIVYTRFKSGIKRLSMILDHLGIKHVQITGDDSIKERSTAQKRFQDLDQDYNVIFITQAGSAAINLQSASVILYYDTPWSYGDLYQSIGRAQRIGSIRENILLLHMVNKGTIDEHVLNILDKKKSLIGDVIGDIAEGALEFEKDSILDIEEGEITELYNSIFNN
jgi:hypothetical protein